MDRLHATTFRSSVEDCEMNDIETDDNKMDDPNNYGKIIHVVSKCNDIILYKNQD